MKKFHNTSIVVPCRNEAGEIDALLFSILNSIDPSDEIIVVEGGSIDETWEVVTAFKRNNPQVTTIQQSGVGKFDAVMAGIKISKKDYIMIWDADGTVSFSDNMKILKYQNSEPYLLTGDRLKGKREKGAMQFSNFIGNWFFAVVWGFVLGRKPLDTLCGTKKFPSSLIEGSPDWLISGDPYGDFTILAMSKIKKFSVHSIPVDYSARKYGKTNIKRWSGGFQLLNLVIKVSIKGSKI
jgi:glycosyltransferase involved in cell wall biosynthesis